MFLQSLLNEFYGNIIETAIAIVVAVIVYIIFIKILGRHLDTAKAKRRLNARVFYPVLILLAIVIVKVWVAGFTHLFYGLSLVSAGLVVVNKETIMNFVGMGIITWRGLFVEGDYIQVQGYSGFVYELGLMYFKLFQASDISINRSSGKMIKIPNGLIINNSVTNFSMESNLLEYQQVWLLTKDSDINEAKGIIDSTLQKTIYELYDDEVLKLWKTKKCSKFLRDHIEPQIHFNLQIKPEAPSGLKLTVSYYCYAKDKEFIDEKSKQAIVEALINHERVHLVFA